MAADTPQEALADALWDVAAEGWRVPRTREDRGRWHAHAERILGKLHGWRLVPAETAEAGEAVLRLEAAMPTDDGNRYGFTIFRDMSAVKAGKWEARYYGENRRRGHGATISEAVDAALGAGDE